MSLDGGGLISDPTYAVVEVAGEQVGCIAGSGAKDVQRCGVSTTVRWAASRRWARTSMPRVLERSSPLCAGQVASGDPAGLRGPVGGAEVPKGDPGARDQFRVPLRTGGENAAVGTE